MRNGGSFIHTADGASMTKAKLLRAAAVAIALLVAGCELPADTTTIIEVYCDDRGLDADGNCIKPIELGAVMAFRVNAAGQKVQITIVKNNNNWFVKDMFLDNCTVIDASNWKCTRPGDETFWMARGQYAYFLGTSRKSSVGGLRGWLIRNGLISFDTKLP